MIKKKKNLKWLKIIADMYFGRKNGETVTLSPGDTTAFAISTI
jgi:hypothetical protein